RDRARQPRSGPEEHPEAAAPNRRASLRSYPDIRRAILRGRAPGVVFARINRCKTGTLLADRRLGRNHALSNSNLLLYYGLRELDVLPAIDPGEGYSSSPLLPLSGARRSRKARGCSG